MRQMAIKRAAGGRARAAALAALQAQKAAEAAQEELDVAPLVVGDDDDNDGGMFNVSVNLSKDDSSEEPELDAEVVDEQDDKIYYYDEEIDDWCEVEE